MNHTDWYHGFLFPVINFAIYLGILWYFVLPAIKQMLKTRKEQYLKLLEESQKAKREAELQAKEVGEKLAKLDSETKLLVDRARQSAEQQSSLIISDAQRLSEHIIAEAKRIAASEIEQAKDRLRKDLLSGAFGEVVKRLGTGLTDNQKSQLSKTSLIKLAAVDFREDSV